MKPAPIPFYLSPASARWLLAQSRARRARVLTMRALIASLRQRADIGGA